MDMFRERMLHVLKTATVYYNNDFVPFWKWKITSEKKKKLKHHQYNRIVAICRTSQYILGAFAILFTLSFERSRKLLVSAAFGNGISMLIMDMFTYIILGYLLGLKRFPANYIALVTTKTVVMLEEKFRPELYNFQVKLIGQSSHKGQWSVVTASPKAPPAIFASYAKNAGIVVAGFTAFWIANKFMDFEVRKFKETVLISETIASSFAALLLVSSFAFDAIPEIKEAHRKFCEIWIIFAVTTLIFVMFFLFERLWYRLKGRLKQDLNSKLEWEAFIFILIASIAIRYIPVIHDGFSVSDVLSHKSTRVLESLLPTNLLNVWNPYVRS